MMRKFRFINGVIFLVWGVLVCLALYRNYTGVQTIKPDVLRKAIDKAVYWYDIYHGSQKIGLASTSYEKVGDENIISHQREMQVVINGKRTVLINALKCICDQSYRIKSIEYTSNFRDEKGLKGTGKVDSEGILFFLESPGQRRTFRTPAEGGEFYLPLTFIPMLANSNPLPHSSFTLPVLDLNTLQIKDLKVVAEEIRPVKVGVDVKSIYKFRAGTTSWWSNEKGIIIKEESTGINLYLGNETIAKDPSSRPLIDYTALPFFKTNKIIENPEKLNFLRIRLHGFTPAPDLYKNSTVTMKDDTITLRKSVLLHDGQTSKKLPYDDSKYARYLGPDAWVSSNNKPLRDTGEIYARSYDYDAYRFTSYLSGYLYQLIPTNQIFVLRNAETILKSLVGDYIERTVMFATYARAGGLPTRLVGGLVYLQGYFYFHAWPEVWIDGWIPVDPTFVQFPADVTHIPLKEGDLKDLVDMAGDLKNIRIEIMEAL